MGLSAAWQAVLAGCKLMHTVIRAGKRTLHGSPRCPRLSTVIHVHGYPLPRLSNEPHWTTVWCPRLSTVIHVHGGPTPSGVHRPAPPPPTHTSCPALGPGHPPGMGPPAEPGPRLRSLPPNTHEQLSTRSANTPFSCLAAHHPHWPRCSRRATGQRRPGPHGTGHVPGRQAGGRGAGPRLAPAAQPGLLLPHRRPGGGLLRPGALPTRAPPPPPRPTGPAPRPGRPPGTPCSGCRLLKATAPSRL